MWSARFSTAKGATPAPIDEDALDRLTAALETAGATGVSMSWDADGTALGARFCVETPIRDMALGFHLALDTFETALEKAGLPGGVESGEIEDFEDMVRRQDQEMPGLVAES